MIPPWYTQSTIARWVPPVTLGSQSSSRSRPTSWSTAPSLTSRPSPRRSISRCTWQHFYEDRYSLGSQAFRYFGWLTMAPIIVLHCLLCCSAFQMGDIQITSSFDIILMKSWNRREERHTLDKIGDHAPGLFGSLPTSKLLSGTNAISISFDICYSTQLLKLCWWVMASWR